MPMTRANSLVRPIRSISSSTCRLSRARAMQYATARYCSPGLLNQRVRVRCWNLGRWR